MKNKVQSSKLKVQSNSSKFKIVLKYSSVVFFVVLFFVFSFSFYVLSAHAATGVNREINFQGKLVDNNGLNVSDNTYTVVFSLYSVSSGGTNIWTETDSVTTKAGIFQVQLGAGTPLPDNVYFNSDSLYLGIKVGADAEMTPRIRFTAVPYALNSASLDGVVATQSATGFNLSGGTSSNSNVSFTTTGGALTFQPGVAEGLTIDTNGANTLSLGSSANAVSFGGSNNPGYTFNGTGGLTIDGTNETIGNGSSATIQTTGSSSGLTLLSQGLGNITLGQNAGNGNVVIAPNAGDQAALIVKNLGSGDLFTASAGATTKFTVDKSGDIIFAGGQTNANSTINSLATSATTYTLPSQGGTFCLTTNNCNLAQGTNFWQSLTTGAIEPFNTTVDLLLGGSSTASARFAFINNTGTSTTPTASISANSGANATFLTGSGILGTTNGQSLTLGTTGNVDFFNTNNFLTSTGNLTLAGTTGINLAGSSADINFTGTGAPDTITTAGNDNLALMPGGSGQVGVNVSSNLLATFDVRGNSATAPVASVSGATTNAAEIVDQSGSGDIFTASKSGQTQFVINNDGTVSLSDANYNACSVLATDPSGNIYCSTSGDKETIAGVYTITAPSGTNLHISFTGAADSAVSSTSGTITFPANTTKFSVTLKGAGGGGGGIGATSATKTGGGGGEGGYSQKLISNVASNFYVKVGGGGPGGTITGTNGTQGTATCIGTTSSDACLSPVASATGGSGGTGNTGAAAAVEPGGVAGVGANGDINQTGIPGGNSAAGTTATFSGAGGGIGGGVSRTTTGNGNAGANGGGGSGGYNTTVGTATGGNGGNGYMSITYYTNSSTVNSGDGWYQYASGVLAPINTTSDVLIGSNATASADFGFLNVDSGTPTASISAGSPALGATYLSGNGALQTTNNQTLTIGGSTTGNIIINPTSTSLLGIGTTTPHADLDVNGGAETIPAASISGQTSFAALVVNNSGAGDLFTASKSGATKFTIDNNGNIQLAGTNTILSTLASAATSAVTWTLPNATGTLCLQASAACGFAIGTNEWQQINGTISPTTITDDILAGGISTASARFAVINMIGAGVPTASLSANNGGNNATYLTGAGALSTTNDQTLTIGSPSTGNIVFDSGTNVDQFNDNTINLNGSAPVITATNALQIATAANNNLSLMPGGTGDVGINASSNLLAALDVRGNTATTPGATVSATSTYAALDINNNGTGDLFTASKSGATKFTIDNNGNIQLAGTNTVLSTLASAATSAVTWTLPNATGTLCLQGSASCGFATGTNEWQQINGAISPTSITDDILAGGIATTSARFAVTNMIGAGTPTASLSAGVSGGAYMTATGTIQTTANQTLTIGGITTGNILLNPASGNYVGIDTQNPLATLDVRNALGLNGGTIAVSSISGQTSFASLIVNNSGAGDLFTASKSGATKFTIFNNGNIAFAGTNNVLSTINSAATTAQTWTLPNATGTVCVSGQSCATNGTVGYLQRNAGALAPASITDDLLLGSTATSSAKFAVINIAGGTPVASLSAGTPGGAYITATGTIQTTANQSLTLGGTTTGNILLNPASGNYVGIDTTTPLATLDVRNALGLNGGTIAVASISGKTSFAALVVNNSGTGDLFTASSAGKTKFTIRNNGDVVTTGNVLIGGDTISASASGSTNNGSPDFINGLGDTGSLEPNSSFEASTSAGLGFADQWVKSSTSSGALSVDNVQADAADGTNSIKVNLGAGGSAAFYGACIPVDGLTSSGGVYNYSNYVKSTTGVPTENVYIDGYTSKANCVSNTSMSISTTANMVTNGPITSTYKAISAGNITPANGTLWGRVHIFVASAQATTINIDGARLIENALTGGLDYAEDYPADPNNTPQPGDVVALEASNGATLVTKADSTHQSVLGVVSTKPGYVLDDGSMTNPVPVALAGRVPVNVSTINGLIHTGDYLAASSIPGVAVKAISAGQVIGTAMEDFDCSSTTDVQSLVSENNICQGQVTMFVKNTYYDPTVASAADGNYDLLKNNDLSVFDASSSATASGSGIMEPLYAIQTGAGIAVTATTALANATIANIQAGAVVAKEMSTDSLTVTTDNIMLGGQTLSDYIKGIVKQTLSERDQNASVAVVNGLVTATQSAQLIRTMLSQNDLSATISGMTVTGVLGADTINAKHLAGLTDLSASTIAAASISAQTITADTINVKHISGLEVITAGLKNDDARITALESLVATPSAAPSVAQEPTISPTEGITVLSTATGPTTVSGDLRVKGNGLIEGILHIADSLFANNFIVNGVSDFFGNVIFHTGVTFDQPPTFNSDTAGIALIKKGTDHIDVTFSKAYDQTPVINASITMISLTPTPSETPDQLQNRQDELQKTILADDIRFVVTNRTNNGFTILLDKPADEDIAFSWLALSVQNSVIFQSDTPSPTPEDDLSPSPIDTIIPTTATNSAGF